MTCRELSDFLVDYVAGELAPDLVVQLEAHLAGCENCHLFVAQYRVTIRSALSAFADVGADPFPEELVSAILATIDQDSDATR